MKTELNRVTAQRDALLAALEWIVEFMNEHEEWTSESFLNNGEAQSEAEWMAQARAAIAAAKGEEN
jgi:hypothetical protein